MEEQILRPRREKIEVKGKISYLESTRSWSQISLRKQIVDEFPQLKERMSGFGYKMLFFHEFKDLERLIRKLKRTNHAVPILMWLVKEKS